MCVTLGPAKLSKTIIYAGEARHPEDQRYIHVLAYQNQATNKDDRANAMILPIPSKAAMGRDNAVSMVGYENTLKDLARPIQDMNRPRSMSRGISKSLSIDSFEVGSYSVALATRAEDAIHAMALLPDNKRPQLKREIFKAYAEWYPDWHIAICAWEGDIKPEPLLWWYEPIDPRSLFYPTLDAHNGEAPNLTKDVTRDHTLLVGSAIHPIGVRAKADLGPAEPYLSGSVWGRVMADKDFNRDFSVSVPVLRTMKNVQGLYDMHARLDPNIWSLDFDYHYPGRV